MLNIVHAKNPLLKTADRIHAGIEYQAGETIPELLRRAGIIIAGQPAIVRINGNRIPREFLANCVVANGDHIEIQNAVAGDGSNPLMIIAMIALTVFTYGAASWALPAMTGFAAGSTALLVAQGLVMIGGSLLIGALFPPTIPKMPSADTSPTYALEGGSNSPRHYQPLPVILGSVKVIPDLGAIPYVDYRGEDQMLYQIFNFGLSNIDIEDIKIGNTPIGNYADVAIEHSTNGALSLFSGNIDTIEGGDLSYGEPVTRTTSIDATAISCDFQGTIFATNKKGKFIDERLIIKVEFSPAGANTWTSLVAEDPGVQPDWEWHGHYRVPIPGYAAGVQFVNDSTKPVRRTLYRVVPKGQYDVRVTRVSQEPEEDDNKRQAVLVWSTLKSHQDDTADYSGQTRLAIRFRASKQLNNRIDNLSAVCHAKIPVWNGSDWVVQRSSNPAWQYLYVARGVYDGSGRRIFGAGLADNRIDLPKIIEWAQWCDAHDLKCNIYLDQPQNSADVLTMIARCGRGCISFAPGKLSVVYDREGLPVTQMFGMTNIRAGSFNVDYINESLADEIVINYIDEDFDWKMNTVRAKVPGVDVPLSSVSYDIAGVTNKDQAGKEANLQAARQVFNRRRISWETDAEGLLCQRGDVVRLSHDMTQWSQSGRLVGGTTTELVLDREVTISAETQPYVAIRYPTGEIVVRQVVANEGTSATIHLEAALPAAPDDDADSEVKDYTYQFDPMATPGRKVKIIHIEQMGDGGSHLKLVAQDEVDAYYDAEDGVYDYADPSLMHGGTAVVSNIEIREQSLSNITDKVRVFVSWKSSHAIGARVRVAYAGKEFVDHGDVFGTSYAFDVDEATNITVELTPIAVVKTKNAYEAVTAEYTIHGLGLLPEHLAAVVPRVTGLELFGGANSQEFINRDAKFVWRKVASSTAELGSEVNGADAGGEDPYFKDYQVIIRNADESIRRTDYVKDNNYTYSYERNLEDGEGDGAAREFIIEVRAHGIQNQVSDRPARLIVRNPAPAVPGGIAFTAGLKIAEIKYIVPKATDFAGVMIWVDDSPDFMPGPSNLAVETNSSPAIITGLESGVTYYAHIAAFDTFGKDNLNVSSEFSFDTQYIVTADLDPAFLEDIAEIEADLAQEVIDRGNAVAAEALARGAAITAEATARGTAISTEQTLRESADEALAEDITALSAVIDDEVSAAIVTEATARATADSALASDITALAATVASADSTLTSAISSEASTRASADTTIAASVTALASTVSSNNSSLTSALATEVSTRSSADSTLAASITALTSTVAANDSTITSALATEASTRSSADTTIAASVTALTSTVSTNNSTLTSAISSEASTRASADSTMAGQISTLNSSVGTNAAAIASEASTRASDDSALASSISTVSSTVGGLSTTVSTHTSSIGGIEGRYGVMINGSNYITGFQLLSGSGGTQFQILADKFAVFNGTSAVSPFVVSGGTIYMSNAVADNLAANSVTATTIAAGAVTASKLSVSTLSAITADVGLLRTASSGARMEMEANQLRAYDSSGTLRARFGVW